MSDNDDVANGTVEWTTEAASAAAECTVLIPSKDSDDGPQDDADSGAGKARTRQNFSWRQVSVLEQVFEKDPLPRQVNLNGPSTLPPRSMAPHVLPVGRHALHLRRRCGFSWHRGWASHQDVCRSGSRTAGRNGSQLSKLWASIRPL
jgi:hypothetical protein